MSDQTRAMVDAVLKDIFNQIPTMKVREVTIISEPGSEDDSVTAKIDVSNNRVVYCKIDADGSLHSARIVDLDCPD